MIDTEAYKKGFKDGFEYGQAKASSKPETATSYWVAEKVDKSHYHYYCNNCGCESKYKKSKYCPDCGRKMEE